jgi:hypothetical protein
MRQAILTALRADADLMALLPGGLYDAAEVGEISRQSTPAAFDAHRELRPCALLRERGPVSLAGSLPYGHSARVTVEIYFYNPGGNQPCERVYDLLHDKQFRPLGGSAANWRVEHADDVLGQEDPALDGAALQISRYQALVRRR